MSFWRLFLFSCLHVTPNFELDFSSSPSLKWQIWHLVAIRWLGSFCKRRSELQDAHHTIFLGKKQPQAPEEEWFHQKKSASIKSKEWLLWQEQLRHLPVRLGEMHILVGLFYILQNSMLITFVFCIWFSKEMKKGKHEILRTLGKSAWNHGLWAENVTLCSWHPRRGRGLQCECILGFDITRTGWSLLHLFVSSSLNRICEGSWKKVVK